MIETPDPAGEARHGRRHGPLQYGSFRALMTSGIFGGYGFSGESVVLGWLLLEQTDSPFVVGIGVALRMLPNFLLGIPGGALADRVDRRRLMQSISLAQGAVAAVLAALALAGLLDVWQILLLTFVSGSVRAVAGGARQAYAFDVVGPSQIVSGLALMSLAQRGGSIAGALATGLVLDRLGAGEAYLGLAVCQCLSGAVLLLARSSGQSAPESRPPVWQGVREYIAELRSNRTLAGLVLLTGAVEVFGFSHMAVLPSLARDVLDIGAGGLGLLNALAATGGFASLLVVSLRGEIHRKGAVFLGVLMVFGGGIVLLGASGTLAPALVAVLIVTAMAGMSDLLTQSLVQSAVANDLRGRAMGSWVLATGMGPVGHLQIGALAAVAGVGVALMANGLLLVALAAVVLLTSRQIRRL